MRLLNPFMNRSQPDGSPQSESHPGAVERERSPGSKPLRHSMRVRFRTLVTPLYVRHASDVAPSNTPEAEVSPVLLARVRFIAPKGLPFVGGFGARRLHLSPDGGLMTFVDWRVQTETVSRGPWSVSLSALLRASQRTSIRSRFRRIGRRTHLTEYLTIVDAVTTFLPVDDSEPNPLSRASDADPLWRCLAAVQESVEAVAVVRDGHHHRFTYEELPGYVLVCEAHVSIDDLTEVLAGSAPALWSRLQWTPFRPLLLEVGNAPSLVQPDFPANAEEYTYWAQVSGRALMGDPLIRHRVHLAVARSDLDAGRYDNSVTAAQTSGEVLLYAVLTLLLWESGRPANDLSSVVTDGVLRTVRSLMPQLIGGDWRSSSSDSPTRDWEEKCGQPRHRVVHAGYMPSRREALLAIQSVQQLQRVLGDRLFAHMDRYPITTCLFLGSRGFERRGHNPPARAVKLLNDSAKLAETLESYGEWRANLVVSEFDSEADRQR